MTKPQRYGASAAPRDDGIFCLYAEYEKVAAERNAALLDAERAREERNRVGVEIRREWMAKCEALRKAGQAVLDWTEAKHRPPVPEKFPCGETAHVRVHALVELHQAVNAATRDCPKCGIKNLPAGAYCKGIQCPLNPAM